jgi:uncharacterized protein GlcG (DUF336 family)
MLVFLGAFALSFVPADWPAQSENSADEFSVPSAERAIDLAETLAWRDGVRVAFVVLAADGEPMIATEMTGTSIEARTTASRRAACIARSLRPPARLSTQRTPVGNRACSGMHGAAVLRHGKKPVALFAVAGAGDARDDQILGAALSVRP